MPRAPRIDAPGAVHHVIVRGIERRRIFVDDSDRRELWNRLARVLPECGVGCFAWAFMPNHVHAIVRTGTTPLFVAMARLNTGYARYFNERHDRVGHLFQNRYKSIPVLDEPHLLTSVRYVHLNPVRAGIVDDLEALGRYRWTGHQALTGGRRPPFQDADEILQRFGEGRGARARIREWMRSEGPRVDPESMCLQRLAIRVCEVFAISAAELRDGRRHRTATAARAALAFLAHRRLGMNAPALTEELGVSRQAVHTAIARGECIVREHPGLAELLKS